MTLYTAETPIYKGTSWEFCESRLFSEIYVILLRYASSEARMLRIRRPCNTYRSFMDSKNGSRLGRREVTTDFSD